MRTSSWQLKLAVILIGLGWIGITQQAKADSLKTHVFLTIHIYNYAEADLHTLNEAKQVTMEVFRKAGVDSYWINESNSDSSGDKSGGQLITDLTHVQVRILSPAMADRLDLANDEMGLAPGKGPGRTMVYICYERIIDLARRQVAAKIHENISRNATSGQILGEMIVHEIGHLLLNLPSHSQTGIMRGYWDLKDLQDAAYGALGFTQPQAKVIRTEVARRAGHKETEELANVN